MQVKRVSIYVCLHDFTLFDAPSLNKLEILSPKDSLCHGIVPGVKRPLRFTNFVLLLNYYIPSWKGMVLRLTKVNTLTTSFVLNLFEFGLLLLEKTVFTFWQSIFHIYYFPLKKSILNIRKELNPPDTRGLCASLFEKKVKWFWRKKVKIPIILQTEGHMDGILSEMITLAFS